MPPKCSRHDRYYERLAFSETYVCMDCEVENRQRIARRREIIDQILKLQEELRSL